uniref:Ketimine reductase mu-crystallin n=1 Tax=Glossina morsitans morsitans TaxID=37546 RepID=A0A1B0FN91_GLOMM
MIPKYIDSVQVKEILTWPLVNAAVEEALKAIDYSERDAANSEQSYKQQPSRTITTGGNASKLLLTMPGYVGNYNALNAKTNNDQLHCSSTLACKVVTSFTNNQNLQPPLPNILANVLLFDINTGELQCIMEGTQITAWRTAAASIVATKYLYMKRFPQQFQTPIKLAIIGCGVQGQSHALGMCATFNVSEIYLWNRTQFKADDLALKLQKLYLQNSMKIFVTKTPAEAVREAAVICIGTYSPNALINYDMLKSGDVHINTVGAGAVHFGEVSQDIYDNAVVYVDSLINARTELKDLKANIIGEIGQVIREDRRTENKCLTIYQSLGMAAEDATVAQAVYNAL